MAPPILMGLLNGLDNLLISDILIRFCEQTPYAFVVLWAVNTHKLTALQSGVLTSIEPESVKACTFGTYYLIRDVIVSHAAFGGAFLWQTCPKLNFQVITGFGLTGLLFFVLRVDSPDHNA